jgi:hypothetical protein
LLALGADPGPTAENIDLDLELPETGAMATAKQQLDTLGVPYTQKERRSPDKPRLHGDLLDAVHGGAAVQGRQDLFVARLSGIVADLMLSRFWRWWGIGFSPGERYRPFKPSTFRSGLAIYEPVFAFLGSEKSELRYAQRSSSVQDVGHIRAVKGAQRAGLSVDRVDISSDGTISIFSRREAPKLLNEWDAVFDVPPRRVPDDAPKA